MESAHGACCTSIRFNTAIRYARAPPQSAVLSTLVQYLPCLLDQASCCTYTNWCMQGMACLVACISTSCQPPHPPQLPFPLSYTVSRAECLLPACKAGISSRHVHGCAGEGGQKGGGRAGGSQAGGGSSRLCSCCGSQGAAGLAGPGQPAARPRRVRALFLFLICTRDLRLCMPHLVKSYTKTHCPEIRCSEPRQDAGKSETRLTTRS